MSQSKEESGGLAYGLLKAINALIDDAPGGAERDRCIAALEVSLVPRIKDVLPHKKYANNHAAMMRDIFDTGRLAIVTAAFEAYPEAAHHCITRLSDSITRRTISEAEGALLGYVAREHDGRPYGCGNLLAEAARRGDRELFETIAAQFHPLEPFWQADPFQMMNAVEQCGSELAPEMARRLEAAVREKSPVMTSQRVGFFMGTDLKPVAAMLRAGCDLSKAEDYESDPIGPHMQALLNKSGSAHGRMHLAEMEPSLAEMLARPSRGGVFYGLAYTYRDRAILPAAEAAKKENPAV